VGCGRWVDYAKSACDDVLAVFSRVTSYKPQATSQFTTPHPSPPQGEGAFQLSAVGTSSTSRLLALDPSFRWGDGKKIFFVSLVKRALARASQSRAAQIPSLVDVARNKGDDGKPLR